MSLKQPTRYTVQYYTSTDTGAPILSNSDGAIKAILKSCLVTGYGEKEGAGWTALFDDTYRIILRRPLRIGNPPDIKVENGVFGGATKHRVVFQDNPTRLDDNAELLAVNLLAKDSTSRNEWYLIASDFGFVLCYAMAENGYSSGSAKSMDILYIGSSVGMINQSTGMYVSYHDSTAIDGIHGPWMRGFLSDATRLKGISGDLISKRFINLSGDLPDAMQRIFFDSGESLPFYTSLKDLDDTANIVQTLDGRPFLSVCNLNVQKYDRRTFYIPLDYWEL